MVNDSKAWPIGPALSFHEELILQFHLFLFVPDDYRHQAGVCQAHVLHKAEEEAMGQEASTGALQALLCISNGKLMVISFTLMLMHIASKK